MWCNCELAFTWEAIDASDVDFFRAPLLNQGVHIVFASNRVFDSFGVCFKDALEKVSGSYRDSDRGVCISQPRVVLRRQKTLHLSICPFFAVYCGEGRRLFQEDVYLLGEAVRHVLYELHRSRVTLRKSSFERAR